MAEYWEDNIYSKSRRASRRSRRFSSRASKSHISDVMGSMGDPFVPGLVGDVSRPLTPHYGELQRTVYGKGKWGPMQYQAQGVYDAIGGNRHGGTLPLGKVIRRDVDQTVSSWIVGPNDISLREAASARNFLVRKGLVESNLPLNKVLNTKEGINELTKRGLIRKMFEPGLHEYNQSAYLPKAGEIDKAIKNIPRGLAKYKDNPDVIRKILSGKLNTREAELLPSVSSSWKAKIKGRSIKTKKEIVARLRGYYTVPGQELLNVDVDDFDNIAKMGRRSELAGEVASGRMSYKNALNLDLVSRRDIRLGNLSKELAKAHIKTGAFRTTESLGKFNFSGYTAAQRRAYLAGVDPLERMIAEKGMSLTDIASLKSFGGAGRVWHPEGYYIESGPTNKYLPGLQKELSLLGKLSPDGVGDMPSTFSELQFEGTQTQTARSGGKVVVTRGDGYASAYLERTKRSANRSARSIAKRDALRARKIIARDAMKRAETGLVAVGDPYGPAAMSLDSVRRMRGLARNRAASQASTSLTAINQSIKESAMLPDIRRTNLLIPKGKLALGLRPYDLSDDLLSQYPGTTQGIEVRLGSKRLGVVPYKGVGGRGSLIRKILGSKQSSAYLESSGTFEAGRWAKMTILTGDKSGRILPLRKIRVAGISERAGGEIGQLFKGKAAQTAGVQQTTQQWMSRMPARWKIGAAIAGVTLGALMLSRRDRGDETLAPSEYPDASMYGGAAGNILSPEGMEEEDLRERLGESVNQQPISYSARIEDPNSIQTNIRIKTGTNRRTNFEAVGRSLGLVASNRSGAELGNVNVRVTDDSRRMNDEYIDRKLSRLI